MKKLFGKVHLWLSAPFGIIITLTCFSGAMLVFEPEITKAVRHNVYYVAELKDSARPIDELLETVSATLPDSVSITGVTIFADEKRTYQVNLSNPRRSSVFVDQYSGRITGKNKRLAFFSFMFRLHRWLLDSSHRKSQGMNVGKTLVGVSTLAFLAILLSGTILWIPRARRNLRRSISIPLSGNRRRLLDALHVAGGMYSLIIVLAMALTGLTWSFEWYRTAFYGVFGAEAAARGSEHAGSGARDNVRKTEAHAPYACWQQVFDTLHSAHSDAPQITISHSNASAQLYHAGNTRATDRYRFDCRSGEIISAVRYTDAASAEKMRGWIYSVHTGTFGGLFTRIIWMFASLLGASLPVTGYCLWFRKHRTGSGAVT